LLWLFRKWGLLNYLPRLGSNCDPPNLISQVARITDVSHRYLAELNILLFIHTL
jgi:hypothetical protein